MRFVIKFIPGRNPTHLLCRGGGSDFRRNVDDVHYVGFKRTPTQVKMRCGSSPQSTWRNTSYLSHQSNRDTLSTTHAIQSPIRTEPKASCWLNLGVNGWLGGFAPFALQLISILYAESNFKDLETLILKF